MPWLNYHSHSDYCDGKDTPESFLQAAIERGFHIYGYSSHAPLPFETPWNMPQSRLNDYITHIARLKKEKKGTIEVLTALEIDYIEDIWGWRKSGLSAYPLDYVIGSVHFINQYPNGDWFCFDGKPEAFFEGMEVIYKNDFRKAITGYFSQVRSMVENDPPHIVGHIDKIKMHNAVRPYLNETDAWYVEEVDKTLRLIGKKGCILEVNTRGLYKHNPPLLYPGQRILERALKLNIPVLINSDAHHPGDIEKGFAEAAETLLSCGYKTLRILTENHWIDVPFTEEGVHL